MRADPAEARNVAGEHPDVVRGLRAELERFLASTEAAPVHAPDLSPEVADELRTLGYIE